MVGSRVHEVREASVEQQVHVAQFRSLGLARRPTGIKDHCRIIRLRLSHLKCRGLVMHQHFQRLHSCNGGSCTWPRRHQEKMLATVHFLESCEPHLAYREFGGTFKAKIRFRIRVSQMVRDFARLEQDIERHHYSSCLEDAVIHNREVRDIGAAQGDRVPFFNAGLHQAMSHLVRGCIHRLIRQFGSVEDGSGALRLFPRTIFQQDSEV